MPHACHTHSADSTLFVQVLHSMLMMMYLRTVLLILLLKLCQRQGMQQCIHLVKFTGCTANLLKRLLPGFLGQQAHVASWQLLVQCLAQLGPIQNLPMMGC